MREIARIQRSPVYNNANIENNRNSFTKLAIVLCAVAGVLLGGFAFKAANGKLNIDFPDFKIKTPQVDSTGNQTAESTRKNQESFGFIKDALFTILGMDRYNPITIVNANYPYFKLFYRDGYLDYIAQQEKEKMEKTVVPDQTKPIESQADSTGDSGETFKEASSSITFEGDVQNSDQQNNPVVTNGTIKVVNETKYKIDINKLLKEPLTLNPSKSGPQIFVYHTHTTESFLKSSSEIGNNKLPSRTTNNNYNVVRVGNALVDNLKKYNINVLHNTTIHDKDYNSSYAKSLITLTEYVKKYSSLKMTIDLHRDAAGDSKLRVIKNINGKPAAQIMFVIGTDAKLSNPNWEDNLKLALKIQSRLNEIAPGLVKPTYISNSRYNQQLTNGSVLIEIGGDGNVIDECVRSTAYLAQAINDVVYKNK